MAELEKQLPSSPFTSSGPASAVPADVTRARLVATGGAPCTVVLFDDTKDVYTLVADVSRPDEYRGTANRKLTFKKNVTLSFTAGTGKLYLYFT